MNNKLINFLSVLFLLVIFIIGFSGCSLADSDYEEEISSLLSEKEGRYYMAVLGASEKLKVEFLKVVQDVDVAGNDIVDGYYVNEKPTNKEMKALRIEGKPVYIVFNTKKEIFRTGEITDLYEFLKEKKEKSK